jgi:fatty-acyl-CoA synthase
VGRNALRVRDVKPGMEQVTEEEIIEFCRSQLARFKVPKTVVFGPLPKTSTGKMQKFILRDRAKVRLATPILSRP